MPFGLVYDMRIDETGLYYLNHRYYNPKWGRFINADNFMGQTGGLLSHNIFAYCANNTVMGTDPTGRPGIFDIMFNSTDQDSGAYWGAVVSTVVSVAIIIGVTIATAGIGTIPAIIAFSAGGGLLACASGNIWGQITEDLVDDEPISIDGISLLTDSAFGLVGGAAGGAICGAGKLSVGKSIFANEMIVNGATSLGDFLADRVITNNKLTKRVSGPQSYEYHRGCSNYF